MSWVGCEYGGHRSDLVTLTLVVVPSARLVSRVPLRPSPSSLVQLRLKSSRNHAGSHLRPRRSGWCPDWQRLL